MGLFCGKGWNISFEVECVYEMICCVMLSMFNLIGLFRLMGFVNFVGVFISCIIVLIKLFI